MLPARRLIAAVSLLVSAGTSHTLDGSLIAQAPAGAPKVELATIHRNKEAEGVRASLPPNVPIGPTSVAVLPGGRLTATGISAMELIREAYGYARRPASNVTGPGWLDVERFDVTIKANRDAFGPPGPANLLPQDAAGVLRDLMEDRFKVRTHVEQKEQNIYELRLGRSDRQLGPGLTRADGSCVGIYAPPGPEPRCQFVLGGGRGVQVGHMTMADLAMFFSLFPAVNTDVVDKTGMPGFFDVKMSAFIGGAVGNAGPDDPRPQMSSAVQDMLGLKLERVRGLANILVVDRVERPTEN
jgi:uncharacterized protein (TIGR03435 family)